jgi:hypothetical protein
MPVSFLALARTLSLSTDILVSVTTRSFLDSLQYFLFRSLKILNSKEKLHVSALCYTSSFAITINFTRNVPFLILEFSYSSRSLACAPMFLTCFGVLHTFAGSTM